jgi:hypothetical protein
MDGKPFPPHSPYLCPEAKMIVTPGPGRINITQVKLNWVVATECVTDLD